MSEKMSKQEAVETATKWAGRAEEAAQILYLADQGDEDALAQAEGKGERLVAHIMMANMWTAVAAVLSEPAPVPTDADIEAAAWIEDSDGDHWQKFGDGRYRLDGRRSGGAVESLAEIQRMYGPVRITKGPR